MADTPPFSHLRIKELEGRILARRQLVDQAPERTWHLDYVRVYEAELQQLQSALRSDELAPAGSNTELKVHSPC